jgi:hypothetical protein
LDKFGFEIFILCLTCVYQHHHQWIYCFYLLS